MRILFMGTPEFAEVSLKALVEDNRDVVCVITQPDKPKGRGYEMAMPEVKVYAMEKNIPVYQPDTLKDEAILPLLQEYQPDVIIVVAYGKILPEYVLNFPKYGCINIHGSLLPKYRGAAPMQRAIMCGESETGVTIMHMADGVDTGDIIDVERFPISETDDFEAIHDRSALVGSHLLSKTIVEIFEGRAKRIPQDDSLATHAAKIEKEDCKLDFTKSAKILDFQIRGITPIPGAFAYLNGKMLKINRARPISGKGNPGQVISLNSQGEGEIVVACGEGALSITAVIPEGKGKMTAGDFIRGRKINLGDILTYVP